ncbi:MAG: dinitrogenase iron-molybdenum cofactor biosynthesis protein [Deltaproteobacteria bacterium]|jgi:predicted Fe-Mo cluster-binding NifX family protein|nr:dinitrogenase iron-molybdenum cofactor biosynthesis protein [Deltaproteobacteria bacterium]
MKKQILAIPSDEPGGLEAPLNMHFGHCPLYTLVEISEGTVRNVSTFNNVQHTESGCAVSVRHLSGRGINVLLAGGMGRDPLMTLKRTGVNVFYAGEYPTVGEAVQAHLRGQLRQFGPEHACKDHGHD